MDCHINADPKLIEEISVLKQKIHEMEKLDTERKQTQEALSKSESLVRAIADSAQDAILMMDTAGCISFWNPAAEHIFGYTNEEAIGKNLHHFLAPKSFWELYDEAFKTFKISGQGNAINKTIELCACRKNREEFPIELSLSVVRFEDGWHAVGIIRDITARRQAEETLRKSENLYRTFINACLDMVFVKDDLFRNLVLNESLAAFFGKPAQELIGKTDFELMPETTAKKCRQTDMEALKSGSIVTSEEIVGDQVYETRKFPVDLGNGKTGVGGFIHNITNRKLAQEALLKSEATLRSVFKAAPIGLCIMKKRVFQYLNKHGLESLGYSESDIIGNTPRLFYESDEEYERAGQELFANLLERGMSSVQTVNRKKNGDKCDVILTAVPLIITDNYSGMDIVTFQDITERKRLEERLQRSEKMEALGTMAGGVAHDLNNVLGIIIGFSELLLMNEIESTSMRLQLERIMQAGKKAAAIVNDLLTLARRGVDSGRQVLNLNQIVMETKRSPEFEKMCSYYQPVQIKTDLETNLLNILGSSIHLSKTLYNLVSNAFEAMPKGGDLTIKTFNQYLDRPIQGYDEVQEGDYAVLSVSDTGEGIAETDLKHIFEPFYTKKVMGRSGTGLGLAVVWGTVKDHHGYINVQSEEGRGSAFSLYFPVTREEIASETASIVMSEYMGNGESILVVDDVKEQRDLAVSMLKLLNYEVSSVFSGEEAIEFLKEKQVDLLVLDMIMDPGIDGLDTYRRVLEIRPNQKAIIVSGFSESDRVRGAQELGAGAYVKKPYVIETLGLAVRRELEKIR
jgi:PAS domain S-box-containing protein